MRAWDGAASRDNGAQNQILLSRSRRLLKPEAYEGLAVAQRRVVDALDRDVDRLRQNVATSEWDEFLPIFNG